MLLNKSSLISGDAGHNCFPDTGAKGYRFEDKLTKEIWDLIQIKLRSQGYSTYDCTPWNKNFNSVQDSLKFRVESANNSNSDFHISIHFNAGGGTGVECWVNSTSSKSNSIAKNICKEISKLGYLNRGVKVGNLYITKYTNMPCVLIECSFVDNKKDMEKYNANAISQAIVNALISSNNISSSNSISSNNNSTFTYANNAKVINDFLYIRDINGNIITGKYVDIEDNITVLDVSYDKQLALVEYPTLNGVKSGYVKNATNCIKYHYQDQYSNGSTEETVYDEYNNYLGLLNPYEKATPLYRKNNKLHVVYNTIKGHNTKSGYVNYNGNFSKF